MCDYLSIEFRIPFSWKSISYGIAAIIEALEAGVTICDVVQHYAEHQSAFSTFISARKTKLKYTKFKANDLHTYIIRSEFILRTKTCMYRFCTHTIYTRDVTAPEKRTHREYILFKAYMRCCRHPLYRLPHRTILVQGPIYIINYSWQTRLSC